MDEPLTNDELDVLLGIAAGAKHMTWPSAALGRLVMRGLVKLNEGTGAITPHGIEALKVEADSLVGCTEGSPEEERLARIADVLDTYE